jgi:hypothetical protein
MRRILLGGLGVAALVVAAPGSALAQHHGQHGSHHRSHHATKVRFERFGPTVAAPSSSGATGPTGSTTPTTPSQDAGKVASFANNVLTIKLNDGSSVSGLVTIDSQIVCATATAQMADAGGDSGSSDGNGGNDGAQSSGNNGDQNDNQGDDDQGHNNQAPTCDSTSLIPGAVVHEADLRVSSSGSQFMDIVLSQ